MREFASRSDRGYFNVLSVGTKVTMDFAVRRGETVIISKGLIKCEKNNYTMVV